MKERATVICKRDDRILYVRKPKSKWALPGGKIEAGETPLEAAARELSEETGLADLELIYLARHERDEVMHYIFMALLSASAKPSPRNEIADCKWLHVKNVSELNASQATKSIVKSFAREAN
jgi:8-oxo-dGTP diphosphatase